MKQIFTVIILIFSLGCSYGQFAPGAIELFDGILESIEDEVGLIGISLSIKSGQDEWSGATGVSSADSILTTSSTFGMGSVTKTFISAAILKLSEDGELGLDDPIGDYLQSFDHVDSTITIREMLNHTSGIFDLCKYPSFFDTVFTDQNQIYKYSAIEVMEQFILDPVFERGTSQEYSNTNYVLLGMIISEIANRPYYEEIFDMFDIATNYPSISCPPFNSDISDMAHIWAAPGAEVVDIFELAIGLDGLFSAVGASGAFAGTPLDVARWSYDLYSGNLLNDASMEELFDYHPFLLNGSDQYGLGVLNLATSCNIDQVGHDGFLLYSTEMGYAEAYDLSIAIMTNDNSGNVANIGGLLNVRDAILCEYAEIISTSTDDEVLPEQIRIHPNPAADYVNISLPYTNSSAVTIRIYDNLGALVYQKIIPENIPKEIEIENFKNFQSGVYYVAVYGKNYKYCEKLIKM